MARKSIGLQSLCLGAVVFFVENIIHAGGCICLFQNGYFIRLVLFTSYQYRSKNRGAREVMKMTMG